ncbi:MAG: hypothetical protein AAF826_10015 [Pseudomonadota bacterium]
MQESDKKRELKGAKPQDSDRDARLRKALRENLNKRKAQTRARQAEQDKDG